MSEGEVGRGEHENVKDTHFDVMIRQFGAVRNVFVRKEAGSQSFQESLAVGHPFGLKTEGECKVKEYTGMTEPEVDGKFAVGFRAEGGSGETWRRARPFSKKSGCGS